MDKRAVVLSLSTRDVTVRDWASVPRSPEWQTRVRALIAAAEARRTLADYDTGSIAEDEAVSLWALAEHLHARVVIEIGTFIGTSTTALAAAACVREVYTCDSSNNCLPSCGVIHTYPKQSSMQMLRDLRDRSVLADLCFFDGVVSDVDADLLADVTHARTVYAFHDYNYGPKIRNKHGATYLETVPRKGVGNVRLLAPRMPRHVLIEPLDGTTLALLVPGGRA